MKKEDGSEYNAEYPFVVPNAGPVSYTHLDVYKRQEYIVTDKNVTITERRHLKGNENFPVYVEKGTVV